MVKRVCRPLGSGLAALVADCTTENGCLPQGYPTSPLLGDAACYRLDLELAGIAKAFSYEFTRYADDITFSGDDPSSAHSVAMIAASTIRAYGFSVNASKTTISFDHQRQTVTGIIVNG